MLSHDLADVPPPARQSVLGLCNLIAAMRAAQAEQLAKGGDVAFARPVTDLIKGGEKC